MDKALKSVVDRLEIEKKITTLLDYTTQAIAKTQDRIANVSEQLSNKIVQLSDIVNAKIDQLTGRTDGIEERVSTIEKIKVFNGEDGYTPVKGKDYFTDKEVKQFKKEVTPVKGVDYFDGKDGYTPVKGEDYFTEKELERIKKEITPVKGVDYFDGINGVTTIEKTITKVPLTTQDVEKLANDFDALPKAKKMTTKAIRDFRDRVIELINQTHRAVTGVTKIIAGRNINITPTAGTGEVTVKVANDIEVDSIIAPQFIDTSSATITRTDDLISRIDYTDGYYMEYTRNVDGFVISATDGVRTWTYNRDAENNITDYNVA